MLCEALRVPLLHESDNGDRQTGSEKVKFPAEAICPLGLPTFLACL